MYELRIDDSFICFVDETMSDYELNSIIADYAPFNSLAFIKVDLSFEELE